MAVNVSPGGIAVDRIKKIVVAIQRSYPAVPRTVTVVFTTPVQMRTLNKKYRRRDHSTTILSFNLGDTGELYLSRLDIKRQATEHQQPVTETLLHLVIHGALHLAGFDHHTDAHERAMQKAELALANNFTPKHLPFHVIHQF